ncbi:hypothetical protein LXL04_004789 [Taraxacum kok-saghyz]
MGGVGKQIIRVIRKTETKLKWLIACEGIVDFRPLKPATEEKDHWQLTRSNESYQRSPMETLSWHNKGRVQKIVLTVWKGDRHLLRSEEREKQKHDGENTEGQQPPQAEIRVDSIPLAADDSMTLWLNTMTLHGELLTRDHLSHLPVLIAMQCDKKVGARYIGGMKAFLSFEDQEVAWVKILGLPLRLWNEKIFKLIIRKFGEIFSPIDLIRERVDLSCMRLGIITDSRRRVNEDISVELEGNIHQIGLAEYEHEIWFPFRFDKTEHMYESEDGGDEANEPAMEDSKKDSDKAISDTWINDVEEGEITGEEEAHPPENTPGTGKKSRRNSGGRNQNSPTVNTRLEADWGHHTSGIASESKTFGGLHGNHSKDNNWGPIPPQYQIPLDLGLNFNIPMG